MRKRTGIPFLRLYDLMFNPYKLKFIEILMHCQKSIVIISFILCLQNAIMKKVLIKEMFP